MIKSLCILCTVLLSLHVGSQTALYAGDDNFPTSMIYKIENNTVYRYQNPAIRSEYLYVQGNKVYFRERRFSDDVKYTFDSKRIFRGNSGELMFTFSDGKIYQGESFFESDVLFTLEDGVIYKGDSKSSFDAVMRYTLNNPSDILLIVMLILPY